MFLNNTNPDQIKDTLHVRHDGSQVLLSITNRWTFTSASNACFYSVLLFASVSSDSTDRGDFRIRDKNNWNDDAIT